MNTPLDDGIGGVRHVTVRGTDLAVEVAGPDPADRPEPAGPTAGDAPWFVWGHGLTSSMVREDEFGLLDHRRLAHRVRTLRYDARGHGRSGSSEDLAGYHWRELAADQLELASSLGIGRYVAGGASMGCATALYAALTEPERIAGLVLAIPPTAWSTRAEQRSLYEANAALVETGRVDDLVAGARALPPPDPLVDEPGWRDGFEREIRTTDPVRLARIFRGAGATDLPPVEQLAGIAVPSLVLAWTGDAGHPVSTAEVLAERIPRAELHLASTRSDLLGWTDLVVEFVGRIESTGPG